jgi:hypothetical protein
MKDMGSRNRIAGVESPEDRHAVTGAFLCSADRESGRIAIREKDKSTSGISATV